MELRFPHIGRFFLLLSVCAGLASCIYEDAASADDCESGLKVGFTIAVENTTPLSRGIAPDGTTDTWGDGYPSIVGSGFDSRIDINSFRMALYRIGSDGGLTLFASLRPQDLFFFSSASVDGGRTLYHMTAYLRTDLPIEDIRRGRYRAMVWVNTPAEIGGMDDLNSLDGLSFDNMGVADAENVLRFDWEYSDRTDPAVADIPLAQFRLIPMWGCATVSLAGIEAGAAYELRPVDAAGGDNSILLLRSMAKTTVEPGEELLEKYGGEFEIHSVTLHHANRQGYVMPDGWRTLTDTRSLRFDATIREVPDTDRWNVATAEDGQGGLALYLPESVNNDNRIRLSVDYTFKGTRRQNDILFCKYSNGKPLAPYDLTGADDMVKYRNSIYDIVRNHHYRFVIGINEATSEIVVNSIRIEDWVYGGGGFLDPVE